MGIISRGRMKRLEHDERPPRAWGVYRFYNHVTDCIDYVGITSNLYNRLANHRSIGKFNDETHIFEYREALFDVTWNQMCEWEQEKIAKHHPHLNIKRGGNGRTPSIKVNGREVPLDPNKSIGDQLSEMGISLDDRLTQDDD